MSVRIFLIAVFFSLASYTPFVYADGTLGVTGISADKTYAQADNTFAHGWKWTVAATVPDDEPVLKMKFGNWTNTAGSFSPSGTVRFYSPQSSNAASEGTALLVPSANIYSAALNLLPTSNPAFDLSSSTPGRQIEIVVEARIPISSASGSYAESFGIETLPDTTPPIISLVGNTSITLERGALSYTDAGATATDDIDGAIASSTIALSGAVDVSAIGTYLLSYAVTDSAGNAATPVTRTILVQDTVAPTGAVSYSNTEPTNQNVVATLTPSEPVIFLNTSGLATTTSGTATTTFTENGSFSFLFADVGNNNGSTTATVGNIDKTAPTLTAITLNGAAENVAVNIASTSVAIALTASEPVNWLSLKVENQNDPTIYKSFQSGTLCADWTTACNKTWSGTLSQGTLADGVYRIRVHARDAAGNEFDGYLNQTIVVDTTAPVITINGNSIIAQDFGLSYTDAGAAANDARDGTVAVASSGSVDVNTEGDYTITYTATDAVGNTATATRTVQVRPVPVSGIIVSGEGGVTTMAFNDVRLQMYATIVPANATNQSVSWIIGCNNNQLACPGGEFVSELGGGAAITSSGLLTTVSPGLVRVRAQATDGSGVSGFVLINISN